MKTIITVIKKELRHLSKNSKSLFISIILPMLYMPLFLTLLLRFQSDTKTKIYQPTIAAYVVTEESEVNLYEGNSEYKLEYDYLLNTVFSSLEKAKFVSSADYKQDLTDLKIDVVLKVKKEFFTLTEKSDVNIIYNVNNDLGSSYANVVLQTVATYSQAVIEAKLESMGTSLEELSVISYSTEELQTLYADSKREGLNDEYISQILPTILTAFLSFGLVAVCSELFTMEKEKKTIEPLLVTSGKRSDILTGKLITSFLFSFLSVALEIVGLFIAVLLNRSYFASTQIYFTPLTIFLVILSLFSVSLLSTSLSAFVFIYSNDMKKAGSGQTILTLIPSLLSMMMLFLTTKQINNLGYCFIPFFGSFISIKLTAYGIINYPYLLISTLINLLLTIVVILLSYRRYNSERILYSE